ncbi:glycosyltransferase [Paenibacillus tyrfis]|uniref:glycosyltransferase n=1 Tax=Paenibacillus tyrfis TaxID=1501230 RepID=UPI00209F5C36|nr:glycosyltransferase family 2 protein [Paenibacillus tyrfis]MCP1311569.1 glycosyltransferase family 2 protein [Paenibacillus tyrfis]
MIESYTYWTLVCMHIAFSMTWMYKLSRTSRYLRHWHQSGDFGTEQPASEMCVIIPVLEETVRLWHTVERFVKMQDNIQGRYSVIIVTTEKEKEAYQHTTRNLLHRVDQAGSIAELESVLSVALPKLGNNTQHRLDSNINLEQARQISRTLIQERPDTIELADELAERYPCVRTFHMPGTTGNMAHQVNYGVEQFVQTVSDSGSVLFALYNADSCPDQRAFAWVRHIRHQYHRQHCIFQQYGIYFNNFENWSRDSFIKKSILTAAAAWQSRWSLGFEIPNALRTFRDDTDFVMEEKKCFPFVNYCIGHGLFFDYDTYKKFKGFSTTTHNEDAIFGLQASYSGVPIIPVPFFESADSPDTVRALYIQKSTWFWGPFQAFKYKDIIMGYENINNLANKFRLTWLSCCLFEHGVRWIAGPTLMVFFLALSLLHPLPYRLPLFILVYLIYLVLPNLVAIALSKTYLEEGIQKFRWPGTIAECCTGSILMFIMHGASAYRTIWIKLTSAQIQKERTPLKGQ